ncbi:MAG: hypothetical protein RR056_04230 [Acetivibrio sp.]
MSRNCKDEYQNKTQTENSEKNTGVKNKNTVSKNVTKQNTGKNSFKEYTPQKEAENKEY